MTPPRARSRRAFLRTGVAVGLGGLLAGCVESTGSTGQETTTTTGDATTADPTTDEPTTPLPQGVGAELVAEGFTAPLGVEFAPGDSRTAYVVDQAGVVHAVTPEGVREEPFLDVRERMVDLEGYEERGLLGLAFHPDYDSNGRAFARYSAQATADTPSDYSHTFVLAEYPVSGGRAEFASERRLLEIPEPQSNHNAGGIAFGPDGYLYVGTGDGGGGADTAAGHAEDWYAPNGGGNGQDTEANLLGSVLRIDVDATAAGKPYAVPDDNPLVGGPGLDEHYAWGFRNPWRLSFTDGTLYVADVGEHLYEEVNVVERGGNYGWNVREGTTCFDAGSEQTPLEDCPDETPDGTPLRDPIVAYPHSGDGVAGEAVVGGYRYTGDNVPALDGAYVFADWVSNGRVFLARPTEGDGLWSTSVVEMQHAGDSPPRQFLLGFGRDHADELYVATTANGAPTGETGAVHRLVGGE